MLIRAGRSVSERFGPLTVYSSYRVVLAAAIAGLYLANLDSETRLGSYRPNLFLLTSVGYLLLALVSSIAIKLVASRAMVQAAVLVGIDIVALAVLAHSSGGVASSITPLLVVTVASAGILLPGRAALVVAAAATLTMIYEQFYFALENNFPVTVGSTQVGLLGIAFFSVAYATGQMARGMQASERLASQRGREVIDLEQLNARIIQRMRTGILVVDSSGEIRLSNSAAQHLLTGEAWRGKGRIDKICPELAGRIGEWQQDPGRRASAFRGYAGGPEIEASMAAIHLDEHAATLVFLEDLGALAQHLQQMKLASLGRLTASIAHEIRNPLSAINHAAQLLAESSALDPGEVRLTEIVQQQALRLDRTVESVLQLSRRQVTAASLLDLGAWLEDFRRDYLATMAAGDGIELELPRVAVKSRFDGNQLQQVLRNLCDNGLRHGRKHVGHGAVRIALAINPADELPTLRVYDNGPGVSSEKVGNLFEPFFTTETTGTGLGLYIARELCEANRARLSYIPATAQDAGFFQLTFSHPGRIAS